MSRKLSLKAARTTRNCLEWVTPHRCPQEGRGCGAHGRPGLQRAQGTQGGRLWSWLCPDCRLRWPRSRHLEACSGPQFPHREWNPPEPRAPPLRALGSHVATEQPAANAQASKGLLELRGPPPDFPAGLTRGGSHAQPRAVLGEEGCPHPRNHTHRACCSVTGSCEDRQQTAVSD